MVIKRLVNNQYTAGRVTLWGKFLELNTPRKATVAWFLDFFLEVLKFYKLIEWVDDKYVELSALSLGNSTKRPLKN